MAGLFMSGCSAGSTDNKTDFTVGDPSGEFNSHFTPREQMWLGTSGFSISPGPDATMISIVPLGLDPAISYQSYYVLIVPAGGAMGMFPASAAPDGQKKLAQPLANAVISASDGEVQAIVAFQLPNSEVSIHGYRLNYERDGQSRSAYIPYSDHVCFDPAKDCPYIQPYP
ncbi:MAG: hypothetical protein ACHQ01_06280 [Candidatus Limnocylindrales bacterium]